jgi:hypothetical protein
MSRFDLNNAADFAKVVLSDASNILSILDGQTPSQWDIFEGSYNGVLFHIFQSKTSYQGALSQIEDSGGRRLAKYRYPYRDGQTTDDLGRTPEAFSLNILIHGPRYLTGLQSLLAEFNKPTPGDLLHPVRGKIRCKPETWQLLHSHESRQAVGINVTFQEHNFTIGDFRAAKDTTVKGALGKAIDAIKSITGVIEKVQATAQFLLSSRNSITSKLAAYKEAYAKILGNSNVVFNGGGSSADIPGLLPVNEGGLQNADGTSSAGVFPVVTTVDRLDTIPVQDIDASSQSVSVAASDLAKQVNEQRQALSTIIQEMLDIGGGQGSLEFHDDIVALRESANLLQDVLERGVASSQAQVIKYTVPRIMSLREVAYLNGLQVDRVEELDQLNPELFSINHIEKDTVVKVPIS